MIKMNKKGLLLAEETLKMVVSIIVIVLLVWLLFSVYYSRVHSSELRNAQSTLNRISEVVSAKSGSVNGLTPGGWFLVSFVDEIRPNQCYNEDCLCICEEDDTSECSKNGVCLVVDNLEKFSTIEIDTDEVLTSIKITDIGSKTVIEEIK